MTNHDRISRKNSIKFNYLNRFSKKAKRILGLYNLKEPLQVVEVDLRGTIWVK